MNKVIDFIKKYKAEIIIILTGASSLFISISQLGGTVGIVCGVTVPIIAIIVYFLKVGFDETLMKMFVALIKTIVDVINENNNKKKTVKGADEISKEADSEVYIERFKDYLV